MRIDIEQGEEKLERNLSKSEAAAKSVLLIFPAIFEGGLSCLGRAQASKLEVGTCIWYGTLFQDSTDVCSDSQ